MFNRFIPELSVKWLGIVTSNDFVDVIASCFNRWDGESIQDSDVGIATQRKVVGSRGPKRPPTNDEDGL